jgi:hypothetical protein
MTRGKDDIVKLLGHRRHLVLNAYLNAPAYLDDVIQATLLYGSLKLKQRLQADYAEDIAPESETHKCALRLSLPRIQRELLTTDEELFRAIWEPQHDNLGVDKRARAQSPALASSQHA